MASSDDGVLSNHTRRVRPLGFWSVVAIIFFGVAGGPFGIEDSVRFGGPRLAFLCLLILPFLWSLPEALVTAELGTMFPEDTGYAAWVTAAFGPFWGFQEGFLSWISGVIDNSLYPLILARYLRWFIPALDQTIPLKIFLILISVLLTYLNYRGLKVVGRVSVLLTIFILSPFVVLAGLGWNQVNFSNWLISKPAGEEADYFAFANVMFWNLNYWDSVSTLGGEIGNATQVLPKALLTAVVLVCAGYLFPLALGVGIMGTTNWPEGFYGQLGDRIGGVWLKGWVILSAVASQVGLFTAELSSDAYLLLGLAEKGMIPKCIGYKSKRGTPTIGLLLSCSGVMIMIISFDFVSTVEMLNSAYGLAVILEFSALIYLRYSAPDFPRPFKIPLSPNGLILMLLPGTFLVVAILFAPFYFREWDIIIFTVIVTVSGVVLYHGLEFCRKHHLIKFNKMEMTVLSIDHNGENSRLASEIEVTLGSSSNNVCSPKM
eukprot:g2995.t1